MMILSCQGLKCHGGSLEKDSSISCSNGQCQKTYHVDCLSHDLFLDQMEGKARTEWKCESCVTCAVCSVTGTNPEECIRCRFCGVMYHVDCVKDQLAKPKGRKKGEAKPAKGTKGFACNDCVRCLSCDAKSAGGVWQNNRTQCQKCYRQLGQKSGTLGGAAPGRPLVKAPPSTNGRVAISPQQPNSGRPRKSPESKSNDQKVAKGTPTSTRREATSPRPSREPSQKSPSQMANGQRSTSHKSPTAQKTPPKRVSPQKRKIDSSPAPRKLAKRTSSLLEENVYIEDLKAYDFVKGQIVFIRLRNAAAHWWPAQLWTPENEDQAAHRTPGTVYAVTFSTGTFGWYCREDIKDFTSCKPEAEKQTFGNKKLKNDFDRAIQEAVRALKQQFESKFERGVGGVQFALDTVFGKGGVYSTIAYSDEDLVRNVDAVVTSIESTVAARKRVPPAKFARLLAQFSALPRGSLPPELANRMAQVLSRRRAMLKALASLSWKDPQGAFEGIVDIEKGPSCALCNVDGSIRRIVYCAKCDVGFHFHCLTPPLLSLPNIDWTCSKCMTCAGCGSSNPAKCTYSSVPSVEDVENVSWAWTHNRPFCQPCLRLFNQKNYCRKCFITFCDDNEEEHDWILCDTCSHWIHGHCEDSQKFEDVMAMREYHCPECRSLQWNHHDSARTGIFIRGNRIEKSKNAAARAAAMIEVVNVMRNTKATGKAPKAQRKKLLAIKSAIHGWGVVALEDIEKDEIIIEYVGERIRSKVCDAREDMYQRQKKIDYMFRIDDDTIIDATDKGGMARLVNHSCEPNCYTKIQMGADGVKHIYICSKRNVQVGEELTYDYKFPFEAEKIQCNCGASICRGSMN